MRHLDSRYGTNPAIVQGAIQKNTNDPNTAPTVLVTLLLPHHVSVFAERRGEADPLLVVTDGGEAQPSEPDRGPWVSLPLRATIPEGNTVGQHACRRRRSAHRIERRG